MARAHELAACLLLGVLAESVSASAQYSPVRISRVSGLLHLPVSEDYSAVLESQEQTRAEFNRASARGIAQALGFNEADVHVLTVHATAGVSQGVSRRLQNVGIEINYVVDCGADGCKEEKSKLKQMSAKQMTNIIQAIDDHAFATGFGTSAVSASLIATKRKGSW